MYLSWMIRGTFLEPSDPIILLLSPKKETKLAKDEKPTLMSEIMLLPFDGGFKVGLTHCTVIKEDS